MFGEERSLETLSKQDAVALLSTIPVGRVVFTVGALPAIVPVAFAVHDGAVVMRTSPESRLAKAAPGGVLAFEIDDIDAETRTGWSVVVMGVATVVADPEQRAAIDACRRDVRARPEGRLHQVAAHRRDRAAGVGRERPKSRGSPLTGPSQTAWLRISAGRSRALGGAGRPVR